MKIKKVIGYSLITAVIIGEIYFFITQVPWQASLAFLGFCVLIGLFISLLVWLLKDEETEVKHDN